MSTDRKIEQISDVSEKWEPEERLQAIKLFSKKLIHREKEVSELDAQLLGGILLRISIEPAVTLERHRLSFENELAKLFASKT